MSVAAQTNAPENQRVLIVDDEPFNLQTASLYLQDYGLDLLLSRDGRLLPRFVQRLDAHLAIAMLPEQERIAIAEAQRLSIPLVAMVDTNCNPDEIDTPIPSNDDATKSISLIMNTVSAGIREALSNRKEEKEKSGNDKLAKKTAQSAE
jgi:CheY-like chemotaxis protein